MGEKKRGNARNAKRRDEGKRFIGEARRGEARRRIGANLRKRGFRGDASAERHAQNVSCHGATVHGKPSTLQSLPLSGPPHGSCTPGAIHFSIGRAYELLSCWRRASRVFACYAARFYNAEFGRCDFATPLPSHAVRTCFLFPPGQFVYTCILLSNRKSGKEKERGYSSRHDLSESGAVASNRRNEILFHFPQLSFGDANTRWCLACQSL